MTHDSTNPPDQSPRRIRVDADDDLRTWARKFNTTPQQIRDAVEAVGDHADDVEMHLKGTRATTNADAAQRAEPGAGQAGQG